MNEAGSAAAEPRRIVTKIVLTYTVEGDTEQKEQTLTLSRDGAGATVDGVVWSRDLMDKLAYLDGHQPGHARPVPRRPARPDDGWKSRGRADSNRPQATEAELSVASLARGNGNEDCIWLHNQDCTWLSLCDSPWPL